MTGPHRVLIVSPRFPSPAQPVHGVGQSRLLAHLPRYGFEPRVVVPVPHRLFLGGARIPRTERSGGAVVVHPRYFRFPHRWRARGHGTSVEARLYRRALRAELTAFHESPSRGILHVHSCTTAGYSLLALRRDASLVVSVHDSDLQTSAKHPRLRHRVAETLRAATHVIYVSHRLRHLGERLIGPHPASVIPWGVEIHGGVKRTEPDAFSVTAVARLVPAKGLDLLVRAFAILLTRVPDARLEIIGDGPERSSLEHLVRHLGIETHVRLLGELDNREAQQRMAAASAFVLPSYEEALGVVYLEAMSHGVPAVGVRGQGIEDVIQHGTNGLLVPPRDVDAIHRAMLDLASDPAWARRLGEAGRRTFREGPYAWDTNAAAHASLYRAILAESLGSDRSP